jgi:hypothetical protein
MSDSQANATKKCFVIGPIGPEKTLIRDNADMLLEPIREVAIQVE